MPTLDEVYRKFGETSEAAQLLETELGTLLLTVQAIEAGVVTIGDAGINIDPDGTRATQILEKINRQTLGQLNHVSFHEDVND